MTQRKSRQRERRPRPAPPSPFARHRAWILGAIALFGVIVVAFVLLQSTTRPAYACDSLLTPPPEASAAGDAGFETAYLGNTHVPVGSTITYGFCPPTSGNHYNAPPRGPIPPAVYGPGAAQPPGGWVHNLEHGYIVVLYRCPSATLGSGDCASADEFAALGDWFDQVPVTPSCGREALAARFDSMTTRFAVLAWNRALLLDQFDVTSALNFTQQWQNVTAPEPSSC